MLQKAVLNPCLAQAKDFLKLSLTNHWASSVLCVAYYAVCSCLSNPDVDTERYAALPLAGAIAVLMGLHGRCAYCCGQDQSGAASEGTGPTRERSKSMTGDWPVYEAYAIVHLPKMWSWKNFFQNDISRSRGTLTSDSFKQVWTSLALCRTAWCLLTFTGQDADVLMVPGRLMWPFSFHCGLCTWWADLHTCIFLLSLLVQLVWL